MARLRAWPAERRQPTMRLTSAGEARQGGAAMTDSMLYHEGNRRLQDAFDSRRISDRLEEKLCRAPPSPPTTRPSSRARSTSSSPPPTPRAGRLLVQGRAAPGSCASRRPTSWRSPTTTATACSRAWATSRSTRTSACCSSTCTAGRGACASTARPRVSRDDPLLADTVGAQLIVRVKARAIFPNCPRYIPKLQLAEPSIYTPQARLRPGRARLERLRRPSRTPSTRASRRPGARSTAGSPSVLTHSIGTRAVTARTQAEDPG